MKIKGEKKKKKKKPFQISYELLQLGFSLRMFEHSQSLQEPPQPMLRVRDPPTHKFEFNELQKIIIFCVKKKSQIIEYISSSSSQKL